MKKYSSVEEYLKDHSGIHLEIMEQIRDIILDEVPDAVPSISYGMPAYKTDKVIAGFYAYKNHVSFYPHAGGLIQDFASELDQYKFSKGALQIGLEQEIPSHTLRKIIKAKLKMNQV